MKSALTRAVLALLASPMAFHVLTPVVSAAFSASATSGATAAPPQAIAQIVKLLEGMLEQSRKDGDKDRKVFAKFLCFCNSKKKEKTAELDDLTKTIGVLESNIEELKGSTGELSSQCAVLKADMNDNELARQTGIALRGKEHEEFLAAKDDMTLAISQITNAIDVLAEVGADQALREAVAADHAQFMSKFKAASLMKLQTRVSEALSAASAFLGTDQAHSVESFLQKPFTGTYMAQSGEVVGILKSMKATFVADLADASTLEKVREQAYLKLTMAKLASYREMSALYDTKQEDLGNNNNELAAKKKQLSDAVEQKGVREEFLSQLIPLCDKKTKEYQERNMLRSNEDVGLSEAVSILNKESSFEVLGEVDANTGGSVSLLQRASVHRNPPAILSTRLSAQQLLQAAALNTGTSLGLIKIVALLEGGNPFTVVLQAIDKLLVLIAREGKVDKEKKDWCTKERSTNTGISTKKASQITALTGQINSLVADVEAPETGLKAQLQSIELSLEENLGSQKSQSEMRKEENLAYKQDVDNLVNAQALLSSAVKVLKRYYSQLERYAVDEAEGTQALSGESDAPPATWEQEKGYKGQSKQGSKVISMLEFVLDEIKNEEAALRKNEKDAQKGFEQAMGQLKKAESEMQTSTACLERTLAEKQQGLLAKQKDLKKTSADKVAVAAYLDDIKAGCDFIAQNFNLREEHRASESKALAAARKLLMDTPEYQEAAAAASLKSA